MTQKELILKLIDKIEKGKFRYSKLQRYYEGQHDILNEPKKSDPTKSDMRAYFNYPKKMTENSVGYILGKPVSYVSKSGNKEFIDLIDFYFSNWEKQHNIDLKLKSSVQGSAYEVSFINTKGEFQCTSFSPLEMSVLYDGSVDNKIALAVRKYKLEFDETEYIEVWDDVNYSRYEKNGLKLIVQKPHRFSRCPVRKLKNNDIEKSEFADIINIVDMYNSLHSISVQEVQDFRNAYLVLQNCTLTIEESQQMKQNGILILPNEKATANWLTKNPNSQFFKDLLENLKEEIYIQSSQVNLNETTHSNTSGVSIRVRMQELENRISISESMFEKVLMERLEFFCEWLKLSKSKVFDSRDVNISFTRNVPVDEPAIVQMVQMLQGIVPESELLSWLPRIQNPEASLKKLKEEQDTMNLDKIGG